MIQLIEEFQDVQQLPFHFYIDNLFTSFNVLKHLKDNGFDATGTVRENRIPKSYPLQTKPAMSKLPRGTTDFRTDRTIGILICRWVDNKPVLVASTSSGMNPAFQVRRYSRSQHREIMVDQPFAIKQYNQFMGGTDRMDQDVARYRSSIGGCLSTMHGVYRKKLGQEFQN